MGTFMTPVEDNRQAIISPINLGTDGFIYAADHLKHGGPLSWLILSLFANSGIVFAPLEKGTQLNTALLFDYGQNNPTVAVRKWLARYIASRWGKDCQLIVEDPWMDADFAIRHVKTMPYFFFQSKPYYAPQGKDMYDIVTAGGQEPTSWKYSIFVVTPSILLPPVGKGVNMDYMKQLAQNIQAILFSAYDRSGYIVWEK